MNPEQELHYISSIVCKDIILGPQLYSQPQKAKEIEYGICKEVFLRHITRIKAIQNESDLSARKEFIQSIKDSL